MTKQWLSQEQIDERMRDRIAAQLSKDIAAYDGSPGAAKEILRGLAVAREMGIDLGPFEDALTARHRALDAA
ncbi:MAG TPA: hypothetical protein VGP64_05180 [Polyangia bacterium]|jgi:hypothetical protein